MPKELGESVYGTAETVKETSDGSGSAGDAVKIDGSDKVTPTSAAGEDVYGILAEDSPSDGESVVVVVFGDVIGNAGGSVSKGDIAVTGTTGGRLEQNADATGMSVDVDGTTDQGVFAPGNPKALSDSGATVEGASLGTNEALFFVR